jgi:hypothetical protein
MGRPPAGISSSDQVVHVSTPTVSIPVNGSADAAVVLSISPGFHINANPATFPYLIATELQSVAAPDQAPLAGKPIYPAAVTMKFAFADQPLSVYLGKVEIKLPLRMAGPINDRPEKGANLALPIKVRVQACDDEKCYSPATIAGSIPVSVN